MVFVASSFAPLPAPTHELNLGQKLAALFFRKSRFTRFNIRQLKQILDEETDATWLCRTKISGRILVSPFHLEGTRGKRHG